MTRTNLGRERKGVRQKWEANDMLKAIEGVRSKSEKLNEAARYFKVSKAAIS